MPFGTERWNEIHLSKKRTEIYQHMCSQICIYKWIHKKVGEYTEMPVVVFSRGGVMELW